MEIRRALFPAVLLAFVGCGENGAETPVTLAVPTDTLFFCDTIGVLMGDSSCMFGSVNEIIPVPEGFAVLDGGFSRLAFFDGDGVFLKSFGRRGGGPGEFSDPFRMCRLQDGEFLIFDFGTRNLTMLSADLVYSGSWPAQRGLLLSMKPGADSMVVLQEITWDLVEGQLTPGFRLYSANGYTGEQGVVYMEHVEPMRSEGIDLLPFWPIFTTDSHGNLYVSLLDSDEYVIEKYSPAGVLLHTFVMEPEDRPGFDLEIHQLQYLPLTLPLSVNGETSTLEVSAPLLHPYVTGLAIDGEENIWVRRMGLAESEHWDVISPGGDLLRRVVLFADTTGSGAYPALHVSAHGLAATRNEYEVERFYRVGP